MSYLARTMFELSFDPPEASPRLAIVTIDDPEKKVNALAPAIIDKVDGIFDTIEAEQGIDAAILISKKPDNFIAGADVETFAKAQDRREIEDFVRRGHALFSRMSKSRKPVVCAIHGSCLGAGLEVALACHYRVCTNSPKTVMALPEVMLGLFPGGGGVTRLPRLVGLREALDIILTGRNIRPRKAKKIGLVDQVVAPEALMTAARSAVDGLLSKKLRQRRGPDDDFARAALEGNILGRKVVFSQARKSVMAKTHGLYPAPLVALDVIERGISLPIEEALALEPPAFAELAVGETSRSLVSLFRRSNMLKKQEVRDDGGKAVVGAEVERLGMVGGGFMGADIAAVSADKGMTARIREISAEPLGRALAHAQKYFDRRARSIGKVHVFKARSRVSGGLDLHGFETMDLIIEAIPEKLELKQKVFAELDATCPPTTVLASNTSAIPISDIALRCKHPERVLGLHFFSPVHKMPLLEIVQAPQTSRAALATALEYCRRIGKTPIVVQDGPGFYTTRVLGFYLMAALQMVLDGHSIEEVDRGAQKVGWPVGPVTLLDEVGIDVGAKVAHTLAEAFPGRIIVPDSVDAVIADGRFGRKVKKGFYLYPPKPRGPLAKLSTPKKQVDPSAYRFFKGRPSKAPRASPDSLGDRLTLLCAMEAVRCLEEGILGRPRDGDIGAVFGFGYPPMRGGPFRHLDMIGLDNVVQRMATLQEKYGESYAVPEMLRAMVKDGNSFAALDAEHESGHESGEEQESK
jgi:3-hydroxyacyl-CoA dehydrogenase/enoyl-CoA hydratase/3-hydroxybutyryl-CoA epimerase